MTSRFLIALAAAFREENRLPQDDAAVAPSLPMKEHEDEEDTTTKVGLPAKEELGESVVEADFPMEGEEECIFYKIGKTHYHPRTLPIQVVTRPRRTGPPPPNEPKMIPVST